MGSPVITTQAKRTGNFEGASRAWRRGCHFSLDFSFEQGKHGEVAGNIDDAIFTDAVQKRVRGWFVI